jgi:enoyl-CoA hydratase
VFIGTRIPLAVALELTLTGDPISADRAFALGLVNVVVPPDEVMDAALAMAMRIARNGPLALRATKELVRTAKHRPGQGPGAAGHVAAPGVRQRGRPRGATAFIERRDPVWTGS